MGYLDQQTKSINDRYDADLERRLREIESAKSKQVDALNKQKESEALNYHKQRVDIDTQKALEQKKASEYMASMGSYNSGDNITAMSKINNTRARGMEGVTDSENQFNRDIIGRINTANSDALNQSNDVRNLITMERAREIQGARDRAYQMEMQQRAAAQQRAAQQAAISKKEQQRAAEQKDFLSRFQELTFTNNGAAKNMINQGANEIINRYGRDFYYTLVNGYQADTRQIGKDLNEDMRGSAY